MVLLDQTFDDGKLLEVLLAEIGTLGFHPVEEAFHDDGNAVKMARAHRTFHHLLKVAEVVMLGGRLLVDLFCGRREDEVHVIFNQLQVVVEGAGVLFQILLVVELGGVDENGADRGLVLATCPLDQRQMSVVQRPHRGYQTYRFARTVHAEHHLLQFFHCFYHHHSFILLLYLSKYQKVMQKPNVWA